MHEISIQDLIAYRKAFFGISPIRPAEALTLI